jgi:hypothetical protein
MRSRNRFCAGAVLSLALSVVTFAGDMQTPTVVPTSPPVQTNSVVDPNIVGDETTALAAEDSTSLLIELLLTAFCLY